MLLALKIHKGETRQCLERETTFYTKSTRTKELRKKWTFSILHVTLLRCWWSLIFNWESYSHSNPSSNGWNITFAESSVLHKHESSSDQACLTSRCASYKREIHVSPNFHVPPLFIDILSLPPVTRIRFHGHRPLLNNVTSRTATTLFDRKFLNV